MPIPALPVHRLLACRGSWGRLSALLYRRIPPVSTVGLPAL